MSLVRWNAEELLIQYKAGDREFFDKQAHLMQPEGYLAQSVSHINLEAPKQRNVCGKEVEAP